MPPNARVIIIDDHPVKTDGLRLVLESEGHNVVFCATSARDAEVQMRELSSEEQKQQSILADVILLDKYFPDYPGGKPADMGQTVAGIAKEVLPGIQIVEVNTGGEGGYGGDATFYSGNLARMVTELPLRSKEF